jgi:hypothetical protein
MPNHKRFDGAALVNGLVPQTSNTKAGRPHDPISPPEVLVTPRGANTRTRGYGTKVRISETVSGNRMLAARKLLVTRPELIAMFDFFPIYNGSGEKSKAGELFDLRIALRSSALESVEESMAQVKADEAFVEALALATSQYESTLAAIFTENSFLQLIFLLRKYAERSTNWSDFANTWTPPEGYNADFVGETFEDYMKNIMLFEPPTDFSGEGAFLYDEETASYTDAIQYYDMGILSLCQLIVDLSFSTVVGIPKIVAARRGRTKRIISDPYVDASYNTRIDLEDDLEALSTWISRELVSSYTFAKIAKDEVDNLDVDMVASLKEVLGESFFSATTDPATATILFRGYFGIDMFQTPRRRIKNYNEKRDNTLYIDQILSRSRQGVVSKLYDFENRVIFVHDYDIKLKKKSGNYRTYGNIITEVDNAFESETPLDFTNYKAAVDGIKTLGVATDVWKKLFRLLDQKNLSSDEIPAGLPVLSEEHPWSPASIYLKALQIFQARLVSKLYSALKIGEVATSEAKDGDIEAINYVKVMGYILWYKMPDRGGKWMRAVWDDYLAGFLTAQVVPAEVEDDDGNTELEPAVWTNPITGATLDAFANSSNLAGYLNKPFTTFQEGDFTKFNTTMNVSSDVVCMSDSYSDYGVGDIDDACDAINNSNISIPPGDTRQCTFLFVDRERPDGSTSLYQTYIKLISAEIIDCQMQLIRDILGDIEDVEPVGSDDPFWPNVKKTNSPYGKNRMNFTKDMYAGIDTEYWVPTLSKFAETFCRPGDFNTYHGGRSPDDMLDYFSDIWLGILQDFFAFDVCPLDIYYDAQSYNTSSSEHFDKETWLYGVIACKGNLYPALAEIFYRKIDDVVNDLMATIPSDIINDEWDLGNPNYDATEVSAPSSGGSTISASTSYIGSNEEGEELNERWLAWANKCYNHTRDLMQSEIATGVGFDILEKYTDRVSEYSAAALNTVGQGDEPASDDNPIVGFVTGLLETGMPGEDILQNINSQQLSLKEVSLARQKADPEQAYIPVADLISENEIKAIKTLFSNRSLVGSEGLNVRSFVVGLPAGIFAENDISEFSIMSNLVDVEYSDLVFRPKAFNFDKDLYVLPEDFDSIDWGNVANFKDLVEEMTFTRIRYDIVENDAGTDLEVVQINEKESASSEGSTINFDVYANHLISALLESYYKIMVGLEISEDTFVSTGIPLGLAISDYAADLGGAMTSLYGSLDSESESLSGLFSVADNIVASYDSMLESFSSEIVAGEFSELDAAMLSKFQDSMSSRLFTAEDMRERVLSAKVFDRLFFFLLDPDEFFVESSSSRNGTDPYTSSDIIDRYLTAGVLEGSASYPKLAPRSKSEGNMNFSKFFFNLGSLSEGDGGPAADSTADTDPDLQQIDY